MFQIKDCIEWNKARYEREFDFNLSYNLIKEEYKELKEAEASKNIVEVLDAVGDITFVCVGILWKLDADSLIQHMFDHIEKCIQQKQHDIPFTHRSYFDRVCYIENKNNPFLLDYLTIINTIKYAIYDVCIPTLKLIGFENQYAEIFNIICFSNNTKSIPKNKVDSKIKANIDKGNKYISPEKLLIQLVVKHTNKGNKNVH